MRQALNEPASRLSGEKFKLLEETEIVSTPPALDELAMVDSPDVDMPDGKLAARRLRVHERAGVSPAHGHELDDFVAFGDLVMDLEMRVERFPQTAPRSA